MNNRISTGQIILIVLLVLVLTGTISLGAILEGFLYVILGIVVLAIIGGWLFRRRLRKMAQQGQQRREQYSQHSSSKREGEVTVERRAVKEREVNPSVGEYVDFEEVDETKED